MIDKIQFGNFENNFKKNVIGGTEEPKQNFTEFLKDGFNETNAIKKSSDAITEDFLAGKTDNLHEVMIAAQKAEVAVSFITEVRNRIVEGYQEFSRMQL